MEPVKGGNLINLPQDAQEIFDQLHGGSNASYAIRFAAGFDGIMMVLSRMGNMAMIRDNFRIGTLIIITIMYIPKREQELLTA